MKIISGQFVPRDLPKRRDVIFLGARSSRARENYNTTSEDFVLQNWIRKYFKKAVYITDLVKTEGRAGKRLREWSKNPIFLKILEKELKSIKPKIIVAMSKQVAELFKNDPVLFKYKKLVRSIYPPYYVGRWNKFSAWDSQFKKILKELK